LMMTSFSQVDVVVVHVDFLHILDCGGLRLPCSQDGTTEVGKEESWCVLRIEASNRHRCCRRHKSVL
jgi:hypothetical protein